MTTYPMTFDSYVAAVEYFDCMGMTKLPVCGIESWGGQAYDDNDRSITIIARGSVKHGTATEWDFGEKA